MLKQSGVSGVPLRLLENFLSSRKQMSDTFDWSGLFSSKNMHEQVARF